MLHQGRWRARSARILSAVPVLLALAAGPFSADSHALGSRRKTREHDTPARRVDPHGSFILRVLAYNIQGRPTDDHSRYKEIGAVLHERRLNGTAPHLVGIQEAFHKKTNELNRFAHYPYSYRGPGKRGHRMNSGLIILSEFPVSRTGNTHYRDCLMHDCFANKGVQHARVEIPGLPHPLEFYNTHVNASYNTHGREQLDIVRLWQFEEASDFIRNTAVPGAPRLFIGDFNSHPEERSYDFLVDELGLTISSFRCEENGGCAGETDPVEDAYHSVDHHFYSGGAGPGVTIEPVYYEKVFTGDHRGPKLSDHTGLEVHYRINW